MSKTTSTPDSKDNGKGTVKQFSEAQSQEAKREHSGKGIGADAEVALSDAQELAEFLHDVAYGTALAQSTDGCAPTFNTANAWYGMAQVQWLLAQKLDTISAAFYGE